MPGGLPGADSTWCSLRDAGSRSSSSPRACERSSRVETRCVEGDLGDPGFLQTLQSHCSELDLGLLIYNAAHSPIGEFTNLPLDDVLRVVDVNVRGPVTLLSGMLPGMIARGRGGVVLMSSLAGYTGAPHVATYAASKAFNRVLAQGLWYELKKKNIDVLACCAGAVRTPGYAQAADRDAPGTLDPDQVAETGTSRPRPRPGGDPGLVNRVGRRLHEPAPAAPDQPSPSWGPPPPIWCRPKRRGERHDQLRGGLLRALDHLRAHPGPASAAAGAEGRGLRARRGDRRALWNTG